MYCEYQWMLMKLYLLLLSTSTTHTQMHIDSPHLHIITCHCTSVITFIFIPFHPPTHIGIIFYLDVTLFSCTGAVWSLLVVSWHLRDASVQLSPQRSSQVSVFFFLQHNTLDLRVCELPLEQCSSIAGFQLMMKWLARQIMSRVH